MTTTAVVPMCHCRSVRHAITEADQLRIRTAEESALAEGKLDLANYYAGRLTPCPTKDRVVGRPTCTAVVSVRRHRFHRAVTR